MDWYCTNCKSLFEESETVTDYLVSDPYLDGPSIQVCPNCQSDEFVEAIKCEGCGKWIVGEYIKTCFDECYCEDCYTQHDTSEV
jgi:hypothetical protein